MPLPPQRQTLENVPSDEEKSTILELARKSKSSPKPSVKVVLRTWVEYGSEEVRADKEAMLAAVSSRPALLQWCSPELQKDPEVVFAALQQHPQDLQYASQSLRAAKDFMLRAVQVKGQSLCYASKELRNDEEVVLAAVNQDGSSLQYAGEAARGIRKVVVAAVQHHGSSLRFASEELQDDPEVVQLAVECDPTALRFASKRIRSDQEAQLQVVEEERPSTGSTTSPVGLFADDKDDEDEQEGAEEAQAPEGNSGSSSREVGPKSFHEQPVQRAFEARTFEQEWQEFGRLVRNFEDPNRRCHWSTIEEELQNYRIASEELRSYKPTALALLPHFPHFLQYCSPGLRDDREVALTAVEKDGQALQHASEALRGDKDVVLLAVGKNGQALEHASEALRGDKDVVILAVGKNGQALQHASEALRGDKEVVIVAVRMDVRALLHASKQYQKDVIKTSPNLLHFADKTIRKDREFLLTVDFTLCILNNTRHLVQLIDAKLLGDKDFMVLLARQPIQREGYFNQIWQHSDMCFDLYFQAAEGSTVSQQEFGSAVTGALAVPGEDAPVLTVELTEVKTRLPVPDPYLGELDYRCDVRLLSGTNFEVVFQPRVRYYALEMLAIQIARQLIEEAEKHGLPFAETRDEHLVSSVRFYIIFKIEEGVNIPVNAWDNHRHIRDFLAIPK
eukprot:CAMPEP_0206433606 /NCGR_PEP_ID=MMETSP0324_2-20121206/8630_1 /ASSEMBLY_ACC=CAM_ASM_000836 /TAXON_ID=2866 /ORGANISM="Crypthecodinium cohnii, Strain Seligo" /LENGTH=676 /DNA_ID=CAMNT_0053899897 /DNA_START=118 /DNA_END=2148 /DNA_ORIENTATION=+